MVFTVSMSKIASEKSAAWALSILTERDCEAMYGPKRREAIIEAIRAGECEQRIVSEVIDTCRNAPRLRPQTPPPSDLPTVPEGRYALVDDHGVTKFYKVTEGKWSGYVFVKALASDTEYPIRNKDERARILGLIAADVEGALRRYGHEIGACGVCGRTLTDEASRAAGIGPICEGNLGF